MAKKKKAKAAKKPAKAAKAKAVKKAKAPPKKAAKPKAAPAPKAAKPKAAPAPKAAPKGLNPTMPWISPYLTVKDVGAAVDFYEKAFGFKRRHVMAGPEGRVMHAEVTYRDGVVMLGPEDPARNCKGPTALGGSPVGMYVYVPDVDALFARATAAGASVVNPPADMFWGDRMAGVKDLDGHLWSFATFQREVSPEEMAKAVAAMQQQGSQPA